MRINPVNVSFCGYVKVPHAVHVDTGKEMKNLRLDTSKIQKIVDADEEDVTVIYLDRKGNQQEYSLACEYNNFVTSFIAADNRNIELECRDIE